MNRSPNSGKGALLCILVSGLAFYSVNAKDFSDSSINPTSGFNRIENFNSSFKTIFGGPKDEFGNAMAVAGDCGLLVAGQTGSYGGGFNDGMVTKLDQSGNIVWSRAIGDELDEYFLKIQRLPDDNYIACGLHGDPFSQAFQGEFSWLVKLDPNGGVIWDHYYSDGSSNGNYARDICQTPDGGFVTCGGYGNLANAAGYQLMVAKFSSMGQQVWTKLFYSGVNVEAGRKSIILLPDQNLLTACFTENIGRIRTAILTKINATNGSVIWTKSYVINNSSTWFEQIVLKNNHLFLNTFVLAPNRIDIEDHLMKLTLDGDVESSIRVKVPNEGVAKIYPLDENTTLIASDDTTNPDHLVLAKINTNGSAYWTKKYQLSFFVSPSDITLLSDSNLVICGTNLPGFSNTPGAAFREAFIIKTDFQGGQASCPVEDGITETEPSNAVVQAFSWSQETVLKLAVYDPSDQSIPITPLQDKVCGVSPACQISDIIGSDTVCAGVSGERYAVNLSAACSLQLQWNVDPADAKVLAQTDTTITLQFMKSGRVKIMAGAGSVCSSSNKTLDVFVFEAPKPDIGKDAYLCGTEPLTLQAPEGLASYLWQDGSTNNSFTATQPGSYWVEVMDEHRCVSRDTAIVEVKDCGRNIYFPNAFTPGDDQLNDVYRPKVFGRLTQFQMKIYDRIGRLVFESTDPVVGWDGRYQGKLQATASFTWYAIYRFAGAEEGTKMQKGTVTLIR